MLDDYDGGLTVELGTDGGLGSRPLWFAAKDMGGMTVATASNCCGFANTSWAVTGHDGGVAAGRPRISRAGMVPHIGTGAGKLTQHRPLEMPTIRMVRLIRDRAPGLSRADHLAP